MNAKKTTYGSDPRCLAKMLGMGDDDPGEMTPNEEREDLLGRRLNGTLPLTQKQAGDLAVFVGELRERLPLHGRALGEALLDEETDLAVLGVLKEHGKALSQAADSEVERDVGLAIYYSAIASAILFHDEKITSYAYAALADAFGRLIEKRWMATTLARHFAKARQKCRKKAK